MPLDLIQTELGKDRSELTEKVEALNTRFRHHSAHDVMHGALEEIEELALVSSFGAESVSPGTWVCISGSNESVRTDSIWVAPNDAARKPRHFNNLFDARFRPPRAHSKPPNEP